MFKTTDRESSVSVQKHAWSSTEGMRLVDSYPEVSIVSQKPSGRGAFNSSMVTPRSLTSTVAVGVVEDESSDFASSFELLCSSVRATLDATVKPLLVGAKARLDETKVDWRSNSESRVMMTMSGCL